jgi:integrase
MIAAKVTAGRIFRAISRHGTSWGKGISENVVWYVVRRCAERMQLDHLAPHDLRRTCAKLCHVNGGEIEQISSSWDTHPFSPRSDISVANRTLRSRLTTASVVFSPTEQSNCDKPC